MNMTLNMNNRRARFFQTLGHNTRDNFCKNNFYPATIKDDNGAFTTRNCLLQRKRNKQLHQIKNRTTQLNRRLSKLCNYVLFF